MNDLLKITRNILYRIVKKRSSILVHIIVPAAVILGLSAFFYFGSDGIYRAAVVDLSQSKSSEYLLSEIEATKKFEVIKINEDEADTYIIEGMSSFVLVIPEDFEDNIITGEIPKVQMMSLKDSEGAAWMQNSLDFQIGNLNNAAYGADYNKDTYYQIIDNLSISELELKTEIVDDYSGDIDATHLLLGMYLMFILMSASNTAFLILEEKRKGTFARIGTAPISSRSYIMANVLSNMIILTIQLALILFLIKNVVKLNFYTNIFELFSILFSYILCCVGFGVLVASATKKQARANAILYLILTPSCMISGCFWPIEFMPDVLRKIAVITPQRWALNAISYAQKGESILMPLLILAAYAALLFIGAAYFVKYKEKQ